MEKTIICNWDTFTLNNPVYLCEDNHHTYLGNVNAENVIDELTMYCVTTGATNVHLFGLTNYVTFIRDNLLLNTATQYGLTNLNVEVN